MIVRFFRTSYTSQYIVIILAGLLLWGRSFFAPPSLPPPEGMVPLYSLLYTLLSPYPLAGVILGFLLTVISAFIFNHILESNDIVIKNSSLAGFIYIILSSYEPGFLTIHPVTIVLFILMLLLRSLFMAYNRNEFLDLTYTAGFLVATGSLIYHPFLLFVIIPVIALILFRSSDWRQYISIFIGLLTPFLFLAVYYFWFDKLEMKTGQLLDSFRFTFYFNYIRDPVYLILTSLLLLLSGVALIARWGRFGEKTIEIRSKAYIVNWIYPLVLLSAPFAAGQVSYHFILVIVPLSMLFCAYLMRLRKPFVQELLFLLVTIFLMIQNMIAGF